MIKTNFSEKLVELRKSKKLTQKYVADQIGLTKRQYAYLEYGHFTCDYWHIIRLCKFYKVSANDLFGIEEVKSLEYPLENNNLDNSFGTSYTSTYGSADIDCAC